MNQTNRLVSIVVAAHNAERFLGQALASLRAQTYENLEIIVCDDASTDATPTIAQGTGDQRIRYVRNESTLGIYDATNRAVGESRAEFVAIYHADDLYDPRIVARQAEFLGEYDTVGAVFCLDRLVDEKGREYARHLLPKALANTRSLDATAVAENLLRHKNTFLRTPSVMVRRSAFDAVGGFDQRRFGTAADLDMWLRLSLEGPVGLIDEQLMGDRHYSAPRSRQYELMRTEPEMFFAVMDRHLSRPGVRALVSPEALTCYRVWRVQDEAERAANAYILGDPKRAVALLNTSLVRPLLNSSRWTQVARVLALRSIVRAAAVAGPRARSLVHLARFRRLPSRTVASPSTTAAHSLGSPTSSNRRHASNRKAPAIRVFLDPFTKHFYGNELFDPKSRYNRDDAHRPWFRLKTRLLERGVSIDTADYLQDARRENGRGANVYVSFGVHDTYRSLVHRDDVLLNAFYLFEVVVVDPAMYNAAPELAKHFRTIYTWSSSEKLRPFVPNDPPMKRYRIPMPFDRVIEPHWSRRDRQGIVIVNSNKRAVLPEGELYTERLRALKHFARNGRIDLWGRLWDKELGNNEAEFGETVRATWRGPVDDKYDAMSRYKYSICYENMILDGWITEKLFDCLYGGVVPIYLGAPDITEAVDPDCFIDARRFANYDEMQRYLDSLTDAEYERFRTAGRDYLASAKYDQFSPDAFADRFICDIADHVRERGLAHLWQ